MSEESGHVPTGAVRHLRLTVSDVERSRRFYVDLGTDFVLYVLPFRDPDGIQLEITAPHS